MTKDFNRDLDQTDGDKSRATGQAEGRGREKKPDDDPQAARERAGEGFKGPADEYAESGTGGAGHREASDGAKRAAEPVTEAKPRDQPKR